MSLRHYAPALIVLLASLVTGLVAATQPRDPTLVAAVFPPWWTGEATAVAAARAGELVSTGGAPFVVIVRGEIGLPARVWAAGGIPVEPTLAGLCLRWSFRNV